MYLNEFLLEALAISKEIGNKEGEAAAYANLGSLSASNGESTEVEEYHQKALEINKETGNIESNFKVTLIKLTVVFDQKEDYLQFSTESTGKY